MLMLIYVLSVQPLLSTGAVSPHPSGTVTTPRHPPEATVTLGLTPWTTTLMVRCTPAFPTRTPTPTPTRTRTPTPQSPGATRRARRTGPQGLSMNSTPPQAWTPTTAPCLCPLSGPHIWAPSPATTRWGSWSTPPRGPACCPPAT